MKVFFNQLFDYNFYCNRKLIEQSLGLEQVPEKSALWFSHILNAHHIWNARIVGKDTDYGVWELHNPTDWEDIHYENQRNTFEIITTLEDFEKRINYENSQGNTFTNNIKDILFHIINHSTHHRGQILANFRDNGIEPLSLDYVHYKR